MTDAERARDLAAALEFSLREIEGLVGRALELSRNAAISGAGLAARLALSNYQAARDNDALRCEIERLREHRGLPPHKEAL